MGQIMPLVDQAGYQPTRYLALADGPPGIGEFSKDLAFELYTRPRTGNLRSDRHRTGGRRRDPPPPHCMISDRSHLQPAGGAHTACGTSQ